MRRKNRGNVIVNDPQGDGFIIHGILRSRYIQNNRSISELSGNVVMLQADYQWIDLPQLTMSLDWSLN